jgi:hypothetical protein
MAEVIHSGSRPACLAPEAKREHGTLVSGDPAQVTCPACLEAGKGKVKG